MENVIITSGEKSIGIIRYYYYLIKHTKFFFWGSRVATFFSGKISVQNFKQLMN